MVNQKSILLACAGIISLQAQAQTKQKANIDHVTVFLSGAEIESSARVSLPQGESEVLFTNVAGDIMAQSISVGADNGIVIQSATAQNDYLGEENLSPKAQGIKDSLELLSIQRQTLQDKQAALNEQLAILKENRKVSGQNTGLSVIELQKLLDLVNSKMNTLSAESHSIARQTEKLDKRIEQMNRQLQEEQQKTYQPGGQLLVKFYAANAATANISISYVAPNAGWTPSYDLRVDKINTPVKLVYKANIYQNTGVKWTNVKMSLSTGNPNEGAEAPVLNPWYLSFYTRPVYAPAPMAAMNAKRLNNAAGYSAKEEEVADGKVYTVDGMQLASGVSDHVAVDNSGINTSYDIDLPYTIPTDGQNHIVSVKDYQLPATYRYFVAPKADRDAFLQARVTDWGDLSLIPASTNIFFEGAYVGQGYIDMRNVQDTLNLSLGRDKKIIVRRENDKNYRSVKTIGSNMRRSYGYTIEVRNTKKEAIDLVVLEQFPISNDKDISVEDKQASGASINDETGAVKWELKLKPAELQTLKLNYTVKYPKDKTVGGL
jgi:uncharacterized protein (TIGR02231 family)